MKIKHLIKLLETKDGDEDVEYIVVARDGRIVTMFIEGKAVDIINALRLFPGVPEMKRSKRT
jgi:hypothetical protein